MIGLYHAMSKVCPLWKNNTTTRTQKGCSKSTQLWNLEKINSEWAGFGWGTGFFFSCCTIPNCSFFLQLVCQSNCVLALLQCACSYYRINQAIYFLTPVVYTQSIWWNACFWSSETKWYIDCRIKFQNLICIFNWILIKMPALMDMFMTVDNLWIIRCLHSVI